MKTTRKTNGWQIVAMVNGSWTTVEPLLYKTIDAAKNARATHEINTGRKLQIRWV